MRLRVRYVAGDGLGLKSELVLHAKNPKEGATILAHEKYVPVGQRIGVFMLSHHNMLNYEVTRSRIDEGGCRVRYVGKNA